MIKKYYLNFLLLLIAIFLMGIGGLFFIIAGLGGDALLVMNQGIGTSLKITTGQAMIISNIISFIFVLFLYRKSIGLGTLAVTLLLGLVIDLLIYLDFIKQSPHLIINILIVFSGILIGGFGVALYIYADLGLSPFEGIIMFIVENSGKRFGLIKILSDLAMFIIGYLLGGVVGVGSLITVFLFGPVIDIYLVLLNKTNLIKKKKELKSS